MFEKKDDLPQLRTGPNTSKTGEHNGNTSNGGGNQADNQGKGFTKVTLESEPAAGEVNLTGLWRGELADGEVEIHITHGGQLVEGIKVSHGRYVPQGKVFFRGAHQGKAVFHGKGVKAGLNYSNPVWHPVQFTVIDANSLLVHGDAYGDLMFKRAGTANVKPTAAVQTATAGTAGGATTGGEKKEEGFFFQRDPDAPLRPKSFSPRAEMLSFSPKVLITPEAYMRIQLYVEIGRLEVGWLGTATQLPNGNFLIDQTFLLEQEVTGTETELSVDGQNKLVEELLSPGTDAALDRVNRLRFWGHSHVRMGTSPSGTDESTMMRFANEGMPFYLRGIFNKLGRGEFTIYYYDRGFRICDAPWAVYDPATKKVLLEGHETNRWGYGYRSSGWRRDNTTVYKRSGGDAPNLNQVNGPGVQQTQPGGVNWQQNPMRPSFELPAELVPSDELRREVEAEFAAKVTERTYTFRWREAFGFGGGNDNGPDDVGGQVIVPGDADAEIGTTTGGVNHGIPPVIDGGDGPPTGTGTQKFGGSPNGANGGNANTNQGTGFFDWFFNLFKDDSPPRPQQPTQKKPCACKKCQAQRAAAQQPPQVEQPGNKAGGPTTGGKPKSEVGPKDDTQ